jgi:tetratricopeptide (TPR) repeat protein
MEARAQYLQAKEYEQARHANEIISDFFMMHGFYEGVRRLNQEMLGYEVHPLPMNRIAWAYSSQGDLHEAQKWYQKSLDASGDLIKYAGMAWHGLGTIDLGQGNNQDAEDKFQRSLEIALKIRDKQGEATVLLQMAMIKLGQCNYQESQNKLRKSLEIAQQFGDKWLEAMGWDGLASIDLESGNYNSAREKLEKAMAIWQQIGDRAGEARTFYQLGSLAKMQGRAFEGLRLVALCYLMSVSIGHRDTQDYFRALSNMASELKYTQEQFDSVQEDVAEAYRQDRGKGLIDAAFPQV